MKHNLSFGVIIGGLSLGIALLNIESPKQSDYLGDYTFHKSANVCESTNAQMDEEQPFAPSTLHTFESSSEEATTAPFAYTFGEAQIAGEEGSLSQETTLSISGLTTHELPPLEQGMVNVTGDYAAYRMLPHGTKFNRHIDIVLPYDSTLLPIGYTPADIMTYYYDELRRQWIVIPRDTVDEVNHLVYSKVNHFTDFINAIIKVPEMPETQAYTPTSIKDLKAANPLEGINLIQPPTPNNNGTANLSYPIDIPAGRQGMQPNLALTYSSGGGNGWLGVGWDISIPAITVETRWGVPRYDAAQESEVYVMNGEQLVNKNSDGTFKPLRHRTNGDLPRLNGNVRFYPRVEEAFDSIVRHGNSPKNYWWEVTDRHGITNYYGKSHSNNVLDTGSVLRDNNGNIAHWALTETRDPYGNRVLYYYNIVRDYSNSNNTGTKGKQIYLQRINYTADNNGDGKYNIVFNLRSVPRKDITVSGQYGFKEVSARLLCNIKINYEWEDMFAYLFITENKRESQFKSRLKDVFLYDSLVLPNHDSLVLPNISNYLSYCNLETLTIGEESTLTKLGIRYHFDYYDYPAVGSLYGETVEYDKLPNDEISSSFITTAFTNDSQGQGWNKATALGATKGKSWSLGGTASVGLGPVVCLTSLSVGGNFNYSQSSSEGLLTMIDMDGDGLADKVFKKNNQIYYRKQVIYPDGRVGFSDPPQRLSGISRFLEESGSSIDWGLQASAGLSLSGSWPSSNSTTSVYFADVNGDGLPDLIDDTRVLFNSLNANGVPCFTAFQPAAQNTGDGGSGGSSSVVITSATQPCGDIIFDGSVSDSLICVSKWKYMGCIRNSFKYNYEEWVSYLQGLGFDMSSGEYMFAEYCYDNSTSIEWNLWDYNLSSPNYQEPQEDIYPPFLCSDTNFNNNIYLNIVLYKKTLDCHPYIKNDPDLDAVKVWIAPYNGYITIYSDLNLIQDTSLGSQQSAFSDGISYSIQHEEKVNWMAASQYYSLNSDRSTELVRESVYRSDYDVHHDKIDNLFVQAGDLIFFRLMSNGNRNFDKVNWHQQIHYNAISDNVFGNGLDIFGKSTKKYDSEEDFVVTGKDYFVAYQSGKVKISGVGKVGDFVDQNGIPCHVILKIHYNTFVHSITLPRNSITSFNWNNNNNNVSANDEIKYSLETSTGRPGSWGDVEVAPRLDFITNASGNPLDDTLTYYLPVNMNISLDWNHWVNPLGGLSPGPIIGPHIDYFRERTKYHIYSKFFGAMYRGWGSFAYNNQNNSGDSPIEVKTLKIPRTMAIENSSDFDENDTAQFYLDSNSMVMGDSENMSEGFSNAYAPVSVASNWVETFPKPQFWAHAGYGNINYMTRQMMTNTRLPELISDGTDGTGSITIYDCPIPVPDVNAQGVPMEVKTVRKQNTSKLKNWSLALSLGAANMGTSHSNGENVTITDYIDLNGDRYPDPVGRSYIQYTMPWGGIGREIPINCTGDQHIGLTNTSSEGHNFGASYSLPKKNTGNAPRNSKTSFDGAGSIGAALGGGTDYAAFNYLDVNGDGLPDRVIRDGTETWVTLNMGYSFLSPEAWNLGDGEIRSGKSENTSLSMGGNFNISQASIGGGISVNTSENTTEKMLLDINGDGLPDKVSRNGSSLWVSYNIGNGSWYPYELLPSGMDNISHGTSFSESANASVTVGFTLFAILKITVGVSAAPYNRTFSKDHVQLIDFNNDGYVDYVTSDAENNIKVRYHQGAKTNLLKQVTNFTGSQIKLNYTMPMSSYEKPQRSWLMSEVKTEDPLLPVECGVNNTLTSYEYYHPHYNRHERMEYGYDSVVIKQHDTENGNTLYRYTVEQYNNRNFLKRGKKTRDILCDANHNPYIEHIYEVRLTNMLDGQLVGDSACPSEVFPSYESEITNYYEGSYPVKMTTRISRDYDSKRNIITYINFGDVMINDEYLKATITYKTGMGHNLISLPDEIEVTDVFQTLLRKRQAEYNSKGKVTQIKSYYNDTDFAQTDLEYNDSWGNVTKITLPPNDNSQRMYYQYTYDPVLHALPTNVTNALGYNSSTQYNYKWGKPTKTIDINGGEMRYSYDYRGRLSSVTAPNEISANTATITFNYIGQNNFATLYFLGNSIPTAQTSHYDPQHLGNTINTTTVSDRWGRAIQVRKDVEVDGVERTQISGRTVFDAFGRTVEQYYPVLATTNWSGYAYDYDTQIPPTTTTYDILDRPLTITDPLQQVTTHHYGFDNDNSGYLRPARTTTDANGNSVTICSKSRGQQVQIAAPLNTNTWFEYNAMGELRYSFDPEGFGTYYEYDMLGRCTYRWHPDAGKDRYEFDPAGNMIRRQTQNLQNSGGKIEYAYNYNQMTGISYPEHQENNVYYEYGMPNNPSHVSAKAIGRIYFQEDASGFQRFKYDPLGNVSENFRTFVLPNETNTYTFNMQYTYDSWGRIISMVYPDNEKVTYRYNRAGDLYAMKGAKSYTINGTGRLSEKFKYIDSIYYNKYGLKSAIWYGNGTRAEYAYDDLQRLQYLNSFTANNPAINDNEVMQSITYTYDPVSNITNMANSAPPLYNGLGGSYNNTYKYDELYRLGNSSGDYGNHYNLEMGYSPNGKIMYKNVNAAHEINGNFYNDSYSNDYNYIYGTNKLATINQGQQNFQWDANGNMLMHDNQYGKRFHCWDEENRLMALKDDQHFGYYIYDAAGERAYKLNGTIGYTNISGHWYTQPTPKEATLYASPYLVATPKGYTKHYYAGTERVVSKLGNGGLTNIDHPIGEWERKREQWQEPYRQLWERCLNSLIPEINGETDLKKLYDYKSLYNESRSRLSTASPDPEKELYFYHPDHLGSASWITDCDGQTIQHLQYLPFGELRVDQRITGWNTMYSFSAKERDEESGYSYFGARYANLDLSIWLSVDPRSASHPSTNNYMYCLGNPMRLIDPNGEDEWEVNEIGKFTKTKTCAGNDVIKSTRIGVLKTKLSGNGVLQAALSEKKDDDGNVTEQSFNGLSRSNARITFSIAAESSSNEWGLMETRDANGNTNMLIGTDFNPDGETFVYPKALNAEAGSLVRYDHSHDCNGLAVSAGRPSNEQTSADGKKYSDIDAWKALLQKHPNASMGIKQGRGFDLHVKDGEPNTDITKKRW